MEVSNDYKLYLKFIDKYVNQHFENINSADPLMLELEQMMEKNKQFFFIIDFTLLDVIFSSKRSLQMLGLKPEEVNPRNIFIKTHPSEVKRHGIGTSSGIKHANRVYNDQELDYFLMSTNHRFLTLENAYKNQFIQCYVFKIKKPELNVYGINIHTDISWYTKKIYGFNNYIGQDLTRFRYPDAALIKEGCVFSKREYEILELVKEGFSSEQIAEKIFLSLYTIETHRRNILKKTQKTNIRDLIVNLMDRGVL